MLYRWLADGVVLVHLGFVAFIVGGGLLALRWRRAMWFHVPLAIWGTVLEFGGLICPLTPLENWLRVRGGEAGYTGGFVEHYLIPVLYPVGLTRNTQLVLGSLVLVVNVTVYWLVWRSYRRRS